MTIPVAATIPPNTETTNTVLEKNSVFPARIQSPNSELEKPNSKNSKIEKIPDSELPSRRIPSSKIPIRRTPN